MKFNKSLIPVEKIESLILLIRDQKILYYLITCDYLWIRHSNTLGGKMLQ